MIYEFDHVKLATQLLPSFMRKPRMVAFVASLIKPLSDIYVLFNSERARLNVEVNYNSQELLFGFVLNNLFDNVLRRITVETNTAVGVYISAYLQAESQPRTAAYVQGEGDKIIVGTYQEAIVTDFFVKVPAALLAAKTVPITRIIKKYKITGKTFELIPT